MTFWEQCALPVLAAVAHPADHDVAAGFLSLSGGRGIRTLGVDLREDQILQALLALGDAGYVDWSTLTYETGPGAIFAGLRVTGRGQQAVGQWPFFDLMTSQQTLAMTFEALADLVSADERPALLRARDKVLSLSGDSIKAALVAGAGQLARSQLGVP